MEQVKFYKSGLLWVYTDGRTTAEKTAPAGAYRRLINGSKVAILGDKNVFSLFKEQYVEVTEIQKSETPNDNYTDVAEFIGATEDFFVSAAATIGGLTSGSVDDYSSLPSPASSFTGEIWLVENGSGGYFTLLNIYKYPKGLYAVNSLNEWALIPANVKTSEDTFTLLNITNWSEYIGFSFDIFAGDKLKYAGFEYINLTGTQTSTTPNLDTTNWRRNVYENTINVAKSGGDFTTVEAALNSITGNDSTNRFLVIVHSGIFIENNPLPIMDYVTIKSAGNDLNTRIVANDPAANLFEVIANDVVFSYLQDISLSGVDSTHYAVYNNKASQIACRGLTLINCGKGLYLNNAGGVLDISTLHILTTGTFEMVNSIEVLAGELFCIDYLIVGQSKISTAMYVTGADSHAVVSDLKSFSANVNLGLRIEDGAHFIGKILQAEYFYDGMKVSGDNTEADFNAVSFNNVQNDALTVENVGVNVRVGFFGGQITNVGRYAFNVLNPNSTIVGNGLTELQKINAIAGSQFYATIIDLTEGDEGTNIFGELHVGTPLNPTESVFGEGDSYTRGMLVYTYDGTNFVNVTTEASSLAGSTLSFPNNNVDSAIYIASAINDGIDYLKHSGIKTTLETALVGGSIVSEYWNGTAWVLFSIMETQSGGGYYPNANNVFEEVGSFQIRYDNGLVTDTWTKNDPVALGASLYWVRFRIATAITITPVFQQIKVHSNRFEINADGFTEYFGSARPQGTLNWRVSQFQAAANSPTNQDVYLSDYLGIGRIENKFVNGAIDRSGLICAVPNDLDTSCEIELKWAVITDDNTGGNIEWVITYAWSSEEDKVYLSTAGAPTTAPNESFDTIDLPAPTVLETQKWYSHSFNLAGMVSRRLNGFPDVLWLTIERTGNAANDTHGGDVTIVELDAKYIKWNNGGHTDI